MKIYKLSDMTRGWFVGDFSPVAFSTDQFEVGVKRYSRGTSETRHTHFKTTEITLILNGRCKMNGRIVNEGDIVVIDPGLSCDFVALDDCVTVVARDGTAVGDKTVIDQQLTVVIPMAGLGSRFKSAGFNLPKPLIDVAGRPMIERVIENLEFPHATYVLVCQREHINSYPDHFDRLSADNRIELHVLDGLTEGTACSVMLAKDLVDPSIPLVIANSDQLVDFSFKDFVRDSLSRNLDGSILTFEDPEMNPKWSFARTNVSGFVEEVREKQAISANATVGIYLFARAQDFVDGAIQMILAQDRTNGEYYVCPVYNYLIRAGARVGIHEVEKEAMHGLGTPDDLRRYLSRSTNFEPDLLR